MKYLGTLDHPIAKMITERSKKGEELVIEISNLLTYDKATISFLSDD